MCIVFFSTVEDPAGSGPERARGMRHSASSPQFNGSVLERGRTESDQLAEELRMRMQGLQNPSMAGKEPDSRFPGHDSPKISYKRASRTPDSYDLNTKRMRESFSPYDPPRLPPHLSQPQFPIFPWSMPMNMPRFYPNHMHATSRQHQETLLTKMLNIPDCKDDEDIDVVANDCQNNIHQSSAIPRPSSRSPEPRDSPGVHSTRSDACKISSYSNVCTDGSDGGSMTSWTVDDVCDYVSGIELCAEYAEVSSAPLTRTLSQKSKSKDTCKRDQSCLSTRSQTLSYIYAIKTDRWQYDQFFRLWCDAVK